MWTILEFCLLAAVLLIFITEVLIPALLKLPLFGSFKKKEPAPAPTTVVEDALPEKIKKAKQKVEKVKAVVEEVQQQAQKNYESAEELKNESDNLL